MKRFGRLAIGAGLALVLLLGYLPTWCRPRVEGRVLSDGRPVEGATVSLKRDGQAGREQCRTGVDGRYALIGFEGTGPYEVVVDFPRLGCTAPGAVTIETGCRETVRLDIDAARTALVEAR